MNVNNLNQLFEHIELIDEDNARLYRENEQLSIEVAELKGKIVKLEQEVADKDFHIVTLHSDFERLEELFDRQA